MSLEDSKKALSDWLGCKVTSVQAMTIAVDIEGTTIDQVIKSIMVKSVTQPSFILIGTNRLLVDMSV